MSLSDTNPSRDGPNAVPAVSFSLLQGGGSPEPDLFTIEQTSSRVQVRSDRVMSDQTRRAVGNFERWSGLVEPLACGIAIAGGAMVLAWIVRYLALWVGLGD